MHNHTNLNLLEWQYLLLDHAYLAAFGTLQLSCLPVHKQLGLDNYLYDLERQTQLRQVDTHDDNPK